MNSFGVWLNEEMRSRKWSMRRLGARAGVSHVTISKVISGDQTIGRKLIEGLARAFDIAEIDVARRAWGWGATRSEAIDDATELTYREIADALEGMTVSDRQDVLDYALYRRSRGRVTPDRGGPATAATERRLAADGPD